MAVTDAGTPAQDGWTVIRDLIENNMESPDGVFTPVVNAEWLQPKK